ncbi:hypothetical protein EV1_005963 [Malus domestica]
MNVKVTALSSLERAVDDKQSDAGKVINKVYGCSHRVRQNCTQKFGFLTSPVRIASSNLAASFDTEVTKNLGLCGSSNVSMVELKQPARQQLTTRVVNDEQSPGRSYLGPYTAEVIGLTIPAPPCISSLCG